MSNKIDMIGQVCGRLTVLSEAGRSSADRSVLWLCRCVCDNEIIAKGHHLRSGNTKSCGCLQIERCIQANTTHGGASHGKYDPEYSVWGDMLTRCYNTSHNGYHNYGGRGIEVDPTWLNNYGQFIADMGRRPSPAHQLDRLNNDLGYSKENCDWRTPKANQNNRRDNRILCLNGESHTRSQWSDITGIKQSTIRSRIDQSKWSIEDAILTPVGQKRTSMC